LTFIFFLFFCCFFKSRKQQNLLFSVSRSTDSIRLSSPKHRLNPFFIFFSKNTKWEKERKFCFLPRAGDMDRLAGEGAGGGLPTAGEATAVDELVVGVLLLLTAAVDVEVVGTVGVEVDGLLLFRWMLDAVAAVALLLASADVSPDPGPLPLMGSCCDGGGCFSKRKKESFHF
jgi:hypothetical protein